jgi:hypothetical protein
MNKNSKVMNRKASLSLLALLGCLLISTFAIAQNPDSDKEEKAVNMVKQIYKEVSGEGEERPDWDRVRDFFVEEAIIVLRTSREGSTQFSLEEFIQDFKDFYQSPRVGEAGFREDVLHLHAEVYHDIAFIGVVYQAVLLNSEGPPQKGVDFWLLSLREGSWKVIAVTNEVIPPGEDLPAMFL